MTKHGQRRQLKRVAAPKLFPIPRKVGGRFTIKPMPGPHPADRSIPLGIILRDILGYARTLREIKKILNRKLVKIDGRIITEYKFPVGIMDIIEIPDEELYLRVMPYRRKLVLYEIPKEEANIKILKIINKRYVKGGNIQLNLFDGRNILFRPKDDKERREILTKYKVGDSIMITVPEQKILDHIPLALDNYAMVILGRHMGEHGLLKGIHKMFGARASTVSIQDQKGGEIITALDYVYMIGKDRPLISLPTEEGVRRIAERKPIRL